ncbi:MAG: reprolysin-like metallopeptidase [Saprospiraceae bacterium]
MKKFVLLFCTCLVFSNLFSQKIADHWFDANEANIYIPANQERKIIPENYRTLALDLDDLKSSLVNTPMEFTFAAKHNPKHIVLPMPNGDDVTFEVVESSVMSPILEAKYPNIKSYAGYGVNNKLLQVRFEIAAKGFRAMIGSPEGVIFIDPYLEGNNNNYLSYYKKDRLPNAEEKSVLDATHVNHSPLETFNAKKPLKDNDGGPNSPFQKGPTTSPTPEGTTTAGDAVELRVYRLALATSAEFSATQGGTVDLVMAELVYAVSRLNFIFEKEAAVRFQLVDNNDELVFLDPDTDPYEGNEILNTTDINGTVIAFGIFFQHTSILNSTIGVENYDIGHLFNTFPCTVNGNGVGGVSGGLGTVCNDDNKARGVSCNNNPSDNFYLGTLSHEVGHQLNAPHPWSNCTPALNGEIPPPEGNDQLSEWAAYEPGSGSTIMSYVGACGSNNVQNSRDSYMHVNSIESIQNYSRDGGGTCATVLPTDNFDPDVSIPFGDGLRIPISTPFQLTAVASDINPDDTLTYCFEQYDLGPISPLGSPIGNAPAFRSYLPTENPTRIFPRIGTIVNNQNSITEVLPTYARDLTFRCTVRDSKWGGGGTVWDEIAFESVETAGPFLVTHPNVNQTFEVGDYVEVTWDVANTDAAPVNCQFVNILLSTNGGYEYPFSLAQNVPNTGSYTIVIPNELTGLARVKIEAADNIFFDISNVNFKIEEPSTPGFSVSSGPFFQKVCLPELPLININTQSLLDYDSLVYFETIGLPAGTTAEFSANPIVPSENVTLTINTDNVPTADGVFTFQLMSYVPGEDTVYQELVYETVATNFSDFSIDSPVNGISGVTEIPTYTWTEGIAADNYLIEIASDPSFSPTSIVETNVVTGGSYQGGAQLDIGGIYFWRIRPQNECQIGDWSAKNAFAIKSLSCTNTVSSDGPITIPSNGLPTIESAVTVPVDGLINDLNIIDIKGNHSAFKDIDMSLVGPDGTSVKLFSSIFCQATTFDFGMDDEAVSFVGADCPVNTGLSYKLEDNLLSIFNNTSSLGEWKLQVEVTNTAGNGGKLNEWTLQICSEANLSPPSLIKNETMPLPPAATRPIDSEFLLTEDPNNGPEEITYTVVTLPQNGKLFFINDELEVGDKFTQNSSSAGNILYTHDGGASMEDSFTFTVDDSEGGLIATPQFNIIIDPDVIISTEDVLDQNEISIFPNPANDLINIGFTKPVNEEIIVQIFSVQGKLLAEKSVKNSQDLIQIQTSRFANGIYFVQVRTEGQMMTERVTIQR